MYAYTCAALEQVTARPISDCRGHNNMNQLKVFLKWHVLPACSGYAIYLFSLSITPGLGDIGTFDKTSLEHLLRLGEPPTSYAATHRSYNHFTTCQDLIIIFSVKKCVKRNSRTINRLIITTFMSNIHMWLFQD